MDLGLFRGCADCGIVTDAGAQTREVRIRMKIGLDAPLAREAADGAGES